MVDAFCQHSQGWTCRVLTSWLSRTCFAGSNHSSWKTCLKSDPSPFIARRDMSMNPELVAAGLRRISAKLDRSNNPSASLVRRDLARLAHNMRVAANGPVSLTTDGEVSIFDIDVKYEFPVMEKKMDEDALQFEIRFVLGSDLEERHVAGRIGSSLTKLQLSSYLFRNADLARTGPPGGIKGDPELNRFGLFPNILVKCLKDAMAKMGLSSLRGVAITDDAFHP